MATLSPHTGHPMYNPNGMGGPPPGPTYMYPQQQPYHQQPAPRQRTAIACRYCRRRKIRCSGFESSHDGRCANCMRFNQECVFTPVSSQNQTFVPAHALATGRPPVLYGAHGQPLPPGYGQDSYQQEGHPPYRMPSPNSAHSENDPFEQHGRGPTLPPPGPSSNQGPPPFGRRSSAGDFHSHYQNQPPSPSSHLPPPHHGYPPTIQTPNYGQGQPPHSAAQGSYYPALPPTEAPEYHERHQRPDSPGSSHRSSSEHATHSHSVSPQPPSMIHPPMVRPRSTGPSSPGTQIPSMQIVDLLDAPSAPHHHHHPRHAADGDMLSRLNSRTGL